MTTLTEIRKRTGDIVPFNASKITTVIQKAFFAETNDPHHEIAETITNTVVERLELRTNSMGDGYVPSVEEIQYLVEVAIMEHGFFNLAKEYIVYRY